MSKNTGAMLVFICSVITFVFWVTSMVTPGWISATFDKNNTNVSVYAVYLETIYMNCLYINIIL